MYAFKNNYDKFIWAIEGFGFTTLSKTSNMRLTFKTEPKGTRNPISLTLYLDKAEGLSFAKKGWKTHG